jgi:hypothetical protein
VEVHKSIIQLVGQFDPLVILFLFPNKENIKVIRKEENEDAHRRRELE